MCSLSLRDFDDDIDADDPLDNEGEEAGEEGEEGDAEGLENDVVAVGDEPEEGVVGTAVAIEDRITTPYMTKYERARILGTRALQIRCAAWPNGRKPHGTAASCVPTDRARLACAM